MTALAPDRPAAAAKRRSLSVLDSVQIAQPCPAEWEAMHAVEGFAFRRVRHCQQCDLRVYNLSAMARTEAEALLRESEGRLCVRLYRRHDGTVLTADCSYFRRAVDATTGGARRMGWILACGFAALVGAGAWAVGVNQSARNPSGSNFVQSGMDQLCNVRPIAWAIGRLRPVPAFPGNGVPGTMAPLGQVMAPSVQGEWIAGGPRGVALMGDTIQGAVGQMPSPLMQNPQTWLKLDEPPAPPL